MNAKWGPFLPQNTIAKCAQSPSNNLGPIWKKPPTRSTPSSTKEVAQDMSGYQKKKKPKLTSMVSPNIPHSIRPDSLNSRSTSSPTTQQPLEHPRPLRQGFQNLDRSAVKTSVAASQDKQTWQKKRSRIKRDPEKVQVSKTKSLTDWPQNIDFDDKEEGNTALVSGTILPIDVWSNNGVKYFVDFANQLGKDRFVIPDGTENDKQALKRANKAWRQYRFSLKKEYYKPKEKTLDEMCSQVEQMRLKYPTKSQLELENEAFEEIMYQDEIPDRPVGYELGVKKGDIYGVHGVLRKKVNGKIQSNIVIDSFKEEMAALHKKMINLERKKKS
ncbi:Glutamyl-tRNA(Gln) amidotransferase subunit B mitochondrial [Bienertia sinuspersici]